MAQDRSLHDQLRERYNQLKTERAGGGWETHWRELSEFLMPRAGRFNTGDRNKINDIDYSKVLDSSAIKDVHVLGAGLMAGMTSPARPWFRLTTGIADLDEVEAVKEWCSDVTKLMLEIFARSNTYRALHTMYEELGVFATGASIILPNFDNVIHHYPMTIGEYVLATNDEGRVNTFGREFDMTVAQIVRRFGYKNCSKNVRQLYDRGQLGTWITVQHIIEPREDREYGKMDAKNKRFRSTYIEYSKDGFKDAEGILQDGGFNRFPGVCPRWMVHGGDIYGVGPGTEALGHVKSLQHQAFRKAEGIDYQVRPPLSMPASMRGQEGDALPGGILYHDGNNPQGIKSAFEVNLNLQHLLLDIQDVREMIKSVFYADLFMMIANDTRSNITAREIAERHEEKLLMLGPVLERLHDEMLSPLIDITFDYMIEARILPPPPQELNGVNLNVEFVSMLAQAQRAVGVSGVERLVTFVGQVAVAKQDMGVWDKLDMDRIIDGYADMTGVDPKYILGNEQIAIIRDQRAQQQQAMQQAAMAEQMANTANKLGNTPNGEEDGGNVLSDITRQFTQL